MSIASPKITRRKYTSNLKKVISRFEKYADWSMKQHQMSSVEIPAEDWDKAFLQWVDAGQPLPPKSG